MKITTATTITIDLSADEIEHVTRVMGKWSGIELNECGLDTDLHSEIYDDLLHGAISVGRCND